MMYNSLDVKNIAHNIKQIRLKTGMSSKDFAMELEINYQNYSKMERGVYTPSLDKLVDICNKLDISANDLLGQWDKEDEVFVNMDRDIKKLMKSMRMFEEKKVKILEARTEGDEEKEMEELKSFVNLFAYTAGNYYDIAEYVYHKKMWETLSAISNRATKDIWNKKHPDKGYKPYMRHRKSELDFIKR